MLIRTGCLVFTILMSFLAGSGGAQSLPTQPNAPAATLLLPYFEVDLTKQDGMTTLFSVNNASATAILAKVTLWSDLGLPVFGFSVYLTGYDMQTINLRDVLTGTVPRTASDGQDPTDTISNQGPVSQDINFASCSGILPPPPVPDSYVSYMQAALTGAPSPLHGGLCFGQNLGTPGVARGYVTVDTVNSCNLLMPSEPGYFASFTTSQNVLWGDYFYADPSKDLAFGEPLVHVRALQPGNLPAGATALVPGDYSFYGRFTGFTAQDLREPLSTNFAARFVSPKDFKEENKAKLLPLLPPSTELIVWRDPKVASAQPFNCATRPNWFPLNQEHVRVFDESENTEVLGSGVLPFPAATQRVPVTAATLPVSFDSGWLYLNLNTTVTAAGGNQPADSAAAQAWVTVLHRVVQGPHGGRYDIGFRAVRLDSAREALHYVY